MIRLKNSEVSEGFHREKRGCGMRDPFRCLDLDGVLIER